MREFVVLYHTGRKKMAFIGTLIHTLIKMVVVGAFAFGGIQLGRHLRNKKTDKNESNA